MKCKLKEKAIKLRKTGLSYNEILRQVPVAKSTLSLWLRSVKLSKRQKQRLTNKKIASIRRGLEVWKQIRIEKTKRITEEAISEIKKIKINNQILLIIGAILYWAEGSKAKSHNISQGVYFSNQDANIVKLYLLWLKKCLQIKPRQIGFEIFVHETRKNKKAEIRKYWARITKFSIAKFDKIYYKKHKISTIRKNIGSTYHGLLRIRLRKSTDINRTIAGWIEGICQNCGVV